MIARRALPLLALPSLARGTPHHVPFRTALPVPKRDHYPKGGPFQADRIAGRMPCEFRIGQRVRQSGPVALSSAVGAR